MDPIATLLLSRAHTVVLDADRVASAATRPSTDAAIDRFEAKLLQLGFVLSLDLAMTLRRLPHETLVELEGWMIDTLSVAPPARVPGTFATHVIAWLSAQQQQPCPWCTKVTAVGALDPCGHLVCDACWRGGSFAGCPICHRRVAVTPFLAIPEREQGGDSLALLQLAFDVTAVAKSRFEQLVARTLSADERDELELMIDTMGPQAAAWLPAQLPVRETMAIVLARLWLVAPDRVAMMTATRHHLATATDVLRVALVLMRANPALVEPMRLTSIPRDQRRAVLQALEHVPVDDMRKHRGLWKRVGERLHPGECTLPNVTAAFAAVRRNAKLPTWGGEIEAALERGDARAAAVLLAQRPDELMARADHVARTGDVLDVIREAATRASSRALLRLAAHRRSRLPAAVRAAIVDAVNEALLARAARRRNFARAVIDRDIAQWDVAAIHAAARANTIYVRGSETAIYKRRDNETNLARLARLHAGVHDGVSKIPPANAPTWFALAREDITLPAGSEGYAGERLAKLVEEL